MNYDKVGTNHNAEAAGLVNNELFLNNIEQNATNDQYLDSHLPTYLELKKELVEKSTQAQKSKKINQVPYWNVLRHLEYMVFENLRFLYLQINRPARVQGICPACNFCIEFEYTTHDVYKHLPSFMSVFMMGFPVPEYLRRMMIILFIQDITSFDKNKFQNILSQRTNQNKESDEIINFLDNNYLTQEWAKFSEINEIRHTYTHAFRLPWATNNAGIYGFPKTISENPTDKIKDELWDFVKDDNAWAKKVSSLPATDFISGAELIKQMHTDGTKMANALFRAFIEHVKQMA